MTWTVLGVPVDCSGRRRGEERGPAALRAAGVVERLGAHDAGDADAEMHDPVRDPATGIIGYERVRAISERVRDDVARLLDAGARPLVLGGCCTLAPGVMAGVRRARGRVRLLYLDGHLDFYDGLTSDTGEAADMPLAILLGHGPDELIRLAGAAPIVGVEDAIVVGDRDHVVRRRLGAVEPPPALERIPAGAPGTAERLLDGDAPLWLHLDLDVLDAAVFGAVTYPQPGGFDWPQLGALLAPVLASERLIGIHVTDLNADRDPDGRHARAVVDFLAANVRDCDRTER